MNNNLDQVVDEFLSLLSYLRDNFFRPAQQMTRNRLSPGDFHAITILCRKGSLRMSELAKYMRVSKQQLTPLIDKLIAADLVMRKNDENDRRIVRIELTEGGREIFHELGAEIKQHFTARLSVLADEELEELERILPRIQEILKSANKTGD